MTTEISRNISIRRSRLDIERRVLLLILDDAKTLETEIGVPGETPPAEVPVIYLDQLHWIALAQQLSAPSGLRESERAAARSIIGLARDQRIVLPFAGAHLVEMAPLAGRRRRDLAATILEMCRGWQMRNPVRVRASEYIASMLGHDPVATAVFTRDPGVLFSQGPAPPVLTPGLPPALTELLTRVIATSAVYSAVLDDEPLETAEGRAARQRVGSGLS
ncbi:MAG: hypothetical protein ACLP8S_03620 [Solirubrobacteraceae bacterium]